MRRPLLNPDHRHHWRNWHLSNGVGGVAQRFYTPRNIWADGTTSSRQPFRPGLEALKAIVRDAEAARSRVRAVGGGWSLSNVAFTEDFLVNTARLSYWFAGFRTPANLQPALRPASDRMVFAQCGVSIRSLNAHLQHRGMALMTSGASNGQTIAGAISTGTHGAANQVGAMQDFVHGMHIVGEDGEDHWIERASRPAVTKMFTDWLGVPKGRVHRDDDLFNAAVVSFGSFGLIHAVLFEAEPLYLLERSVIRHDYAKVQTAMHTLDVSSLSLPGGGALPYHFEIVVNPYRRKRGQRGAFVRALYKRADDELPSPSPSAGHQLNSEDLVSIAATVTDAVPELIPAILSSELESALPETGGTPISGPPGAHFGDSTPPGGGTSMELGVPLDEVAAAAEAIFAAIDRFTFGAPVAFRYVKASTALLAFTHYAPITCCIELPGIDSNRTREGFERIWEALATAGVRHTFHWGQVFPADPGVLKAAYGDRRTRWLTCRRAFLSTAARHTFSNSLLDRAGLNEL